MMTQLKKCIATNVILLFALLFAAGMAAAAQVAGTVTRLSGPLLAKKTDGTAKILALKSEVEQGDTLITEKNTYAQIKFIDNSEVTLRPGTTLTVENFAFDEGKPDGDSAAFNLLKGGLRSVTGLLGKRSKERFALKTPTATIGIRGTTFIAEYEPPTAQELARLEAYNLASTAALQPGLLPGPARAEIASVAPIVPMAPMQVAQATPSVPGARAPGLYVQVLDGIINLSNNGGSQSFSAGQFGFSPSFKQPPVVLPVNPGIQFTPPPSFSSSSASSGNSSNSKAANVDCVVR